MPKSMAVAVISTGLRRVRPASMAAARGSRFFSTRTSLAKLTSRIELDAAIPTAMIVPINDSTLIVVCVNVSTPQYPCQSARHGKDDDERVNPGLKQDDHQQVDQDNGQHQTGPKFSKRLLHDTRLAKDVDSHPNR